MSLRCLMAPGMLLGAGMGGFVDGILFHQILQIHSMVSARHPQDTLVNVEVGMFWDGLFHVGTWTMTATGIWMLWRARNREPAIGDGRKLTGCMLMGWGGFNMAEGLLNHHILHTHHVVERLGVSIWDWAFLTSGCVLFGIGILLARAKPRFTRRQRFSRSRNGR